MESFIRTIGYGIRSVACLVAIGLLLSLTGCASVMLTLKVDPSKSYTENGESEVSFIGIEESSRTLLIGTDEGACRIKMISDWQGLEKVIKEERAPGLLVLRREGLRSCSAELHFTKRAGENDKSPTQDEKTFDLRGVRIKDAESNILTAQLVSAQGHPIILYKEEKRSVLKRFGYRSLALAVGIGIDYAILSSSMSSGGKVLTELWAGYVIGCSNVRGNGFC